jgi:Metallo-beta-lactamase superfamily
VDEDVIAQPLAALPTPLDRSLLHVFVAGPGYGEGIAVALPGRGWILLDGCRVANDELPLLAILDRWQTQGDPLDALLLTHPHTDHAFGVRRIVEERAPARLGVTTAPAEPSLIFDALMPRSSPTATALEKRRGQIVIGALRAIQQRFHAAPSVLLALVDGARIPSSGDGMTLTVRSPEAALVDELLRHPRRGQENLLSVVLELQFGLTQIVLGSDLPSNDARGASLPGGWSAVLARHPHLGGHHAMKLPHHGSPAAFHEGLMTAGAARPWWISPFNQGKRLPPTDLDGVPRLVERNGEVSLTAAPLARSSQPVLASPGDVPLAELSLLFALSGPPMNNEAFNVTPPKMEPLEPIWCAAFDDRGRLRGTWRGDRAFRVVP